MNAEIEKNKFNNNMIFFIISFILVLLDQITKLLVKGFNLFGISHQGMEIGDSHSLLGDFLRITYIENEGMAFGISFGPGKVFLSTFSLIASIAIIWYMQKIKDYSAWVRFGLSFILAGAFGNFIDRMFYGIFYSESPLFFGRVVDFIQVDIPDINIAGINFTHWPIFNIADSCVTIGVGLLLIFYSQIPNFEDIFANSKSDDTELESNKN